MVVPNALRSSAYDADDEIALFAPPKQEQPSLNLPMFRQLNAIVAPLPTSYNKFSLGTFAS